MEVYMNNLIFDTIATLVRLSMALLGDGEVEVIRDEKEVVAMAEEFLLSADKNNDISQRYTDIIKECENRKDYYFVRAILCRLDLSVDLSDAIKGYDFNTMRISSEKGKSFSGLNSNIDETGIIILPKVKMLKALNEHANAEGEHLPRKNANDWLEDINIKLQQVYYVKKSEIATYKIKNYLFASPVEQEDKDFIRIGISPILNQKMDALFDIDYYYGETPDGLHRTQLFGIRKILFEELINKKTKLAFERACAEKCDIFISPEMLGSDELSSIDDEISESFRPRLSNGFQTPFLTLPPTQWTHQKNVLTLFDKNGEKIGEQHKQNRFKYNHDNTDWYEDLRASNKEIILIHIEGWGRFAFPICVDFLNEHYRSILTKQLKATFLLCPSFSDGTYNFDLSAANDSEFEVRTIWVNSCSAHKHSVDCVGEVSVPTCLDRSRRTKIERECKGACTDICLFVVEIPKDCNDEKREVKVKHIHEYE